MKAKLEYADFVTELNKGIEVALSTKLVCPDFAAAIKGIHKLDSMQSRINDALAAGKAEATTLANDVKTKLEYIAESAKGYEHLINVHNIAFADIDYIKLYIQTAKADEDKRKADHEAAIKAKAEADAKAKLEAEAKAEKEALEISQTQYEEMLTSPINEQDFKNVFGDAATTNTGEVGAKHIPVANTYSRPPTRLQLIEGIAAHFKVNDSVAERWLIAEFGAEKVAA